MKDILPVGGQAVIEGVMMRSPNCLAVVVRTPTESIIVRQRKWMSLALKWRFFRWPFFRGILTLGESLHNGISALNFSAQVQEDPETATETPASLWVTMGLAVVLALGLFAALPHFLTWGLGWIADTETLTTGTSVWFHLVDGVIKFAIFLAYVWGISFLPDVRRVFMYHGAEHKGIYSHERREELTVENASRHTTLHPRCGTAFLLVVLVTAIVVFTVLFPFIPDLTEYLVVNHLFLVFVKLLLLFPIAGLAYEVIRLAGRKPDNRLLSLAIWPGLMMQKLTTREPDQAQLEISIVSLRTVLAAEAAYGEDPNTEVAERQDEYESFEHFLRQQEEAA
jgi:uncharacterized protein YqhQ